MLKRISVRDVRLGMHIEQLCGNWLDHPFWKKSFVLDSEKDLHALKTCGIEEVLIDTDKGFDIETAPAAGARPPEESAAPRAVEKKHERIVPMQEEALRVQKLPPRGQRVVEAIFDGARKGNVQKLDEAIVLVDEIMQSVARNPGALLSLARLRSADNHTYMHSVAVSALMVALGRQMGMEGNTLKEAGLAGLLHDVGKAAIPEEIINKPGKLTPAEFEVVKTHSRRGWEMLKADPGVSDVVLDVCLHHHEWTNGAGYPDKISGDYLSLPARMAAVCDVYDALTSDNSYRRAYSPADAIRKMTEGQDTQFDKLVFHAFVKTVGIFPVGTLVKLKSGRLAVVMDQSVKSLTTPVVKVFFSTRTNAPLFPELVDTSKVPDSIASIEDPHKWKFDLRAMAGI